MIPKNISDKQKKNLNANDWVEIIVLSLMFIVKITPTLQYTFTGIIWSLMYHIVFFLWFGFTLLRSNDWALSTSNLKSVFLWLLYLFLTFVFFSNTQWGYFSLLLSFWEPLIIFFYYTQIDNNPRKREIIAWIAIAALAYGLLQSIITVNANELAAREASSGHSSEDAVLTGNYSFTASITILFTMMISYIQTNKFKSHKVIWLLSAGIIVGAVIFVLKCNLMISIITIFVAVFFYLLMNGKKKFSIQRLFVIVLGICAIFLIAPTIGNLLAKAIDSLGTLINTKVVSDRTALISRWLRGGSMEGNMKSRFNLCKIALNTFLENPIFGIGPQNNSLLYFQTKLGLHATFFDELARFGIVGTSLLILPFFRYYNFVVSSLREGSRIRAFRTGFWIFIVISMLNPVASANIGIALFYIMPVILLEEA